MQRRKTNLYHREHRGTQGRAFPFETFFERKSAIRFLLIFASAYTLLYESGSRSADAAAALLWIQHFSSAAGAHCAQPAGRARHVRGNAHGRRQISLLSVAGGGFGRHGRSDFAADRADAGSGNATGADGNSS